MKQMVNFRLSEHAVVTLSDLQRKLHFSKTEIIEKALRFYALRKLPHRPKILECAGMLNEKEADEMLFHIKTNKKNKNQDFSL